MAAKDVSLCAALLAAAVLFVAWGLLQNVAGKGAGKKEKQQMGLRQSCRPFINKHDLII